MSDTQMHPASGSGSGGGPPASPQQFCLRWNNYQSNLMNVFDQLLQSESFVDVTLACEGHSVKAHKMVLAACSPYFQSLFFDNPCQHPIVILKDIKWPELKAAVEFMYKGEINVSQEQIGPLLRVAETLRIRGLADVNGEQELGKRPGDDISVVGKKRRRTSVETNSPSNVGGGSGGGCDEEDNSIAESLEGRALELVTTSPPESLPLSAPPTPQSTSSVVQHPLGPPPPPPPAPSQVIQQPSQQAPPPPPPSSAEDMEIKPGIAEMIREEERAKMLESTHAWFGASTSSLADSYQYQLQSMWQKCWNTNQSIVHNLRFRERGPLKSWRPETMAEAILSVLKEGLSLSQAARKYDIPYPTFVLYANRVHNMLGPSVDGGSDLRPKGRGRPQRILLGIWPEDHIHGVIRAVVFRDPQHIKEENINLNYHRIQNVAQSRTPQLGAPPYLTPGNAYPPGYPHENSVHGYGGGGGSGGGSGSGSAPGSVDSLGGGAGGGVSPNSAAAAVVAVAQNLRQQMLAAAAHHTQHQQQQQQHHPSQGHPGQVNHGGGQSHLGPGSNQMNHGDSGHHPSSNHHGSPVASAAGFGFLAAAAAAAHCANGSNLVLHSPSPVNSSPSSSPLTQPNNNMEIGLPLSFKPMINDSLQSQRSDHLFQDEIEDLVKRPHQTDPQKMKMGMSLSFKPIVNDSLQSQRNERLFQDDIEDLVKRPQNDSSKMKPPQNPYSSMPNDLSIKSEHIFQDDLDIIKRSPVSESAKVKVGIGVSGMTYKGGCDTYVSQSFQSEIEDLVKSPQSGQQKEPIHMSVDQRSD